MSNYANGFVADGTEYQIIPPGAMAAQNGGVQAEGVTAGQTYVQAVIGADGRLYVPVQNNATTTEAGYAADARALAALRTSVSPATIMHLGNSGTPTDGTAVLPTTPTGTNATMTYFFSLPAGATLLGASIGSGTTNAVILSWGISQVNSSVTIRAYNLSSSTTVTWSQIYARPIYRLST